MEKGINFGKLPSMVFEAVIEERIRQDSLHPDDPPSDPDFAVVLMEEVGEVAKATFECDYDELETELVQTMAVCLRWLQNLDRELNN